MIKKIIKFFDKIEDSVRIRLSRRPVVYAFIGGTGVIIFWRGIWHTTDYVMQCISSFSRSSSSDLSGMIWWDGPFSIAIGGGLLLITGVLVPSFIGNELIISGIRKEKKVAEKTEEELMDEVALVQDMHKRVKNLEKLMRSREGNIGK